MSIRVTLKNEIGESVLKCTGITFRLYIPQGVTLPMSDVRRKVPSDIRVRWFRGGLDIPVIDTLLLIDGKRQSDRTVMDTLLLRDGRRKCHEKSRYIAEWLASYFSLKIQVILHDVDNLPNINDPFYQRPYVVVVGLWDFFVSGSLFIQTHFPEYEDVTFGYDMPTTPYGTWDTVSLLRRHVPRDRIPVIVTLVGFRTFDTRRLECMKVSLRLWFTVGWNKRKYGTRLSDLRSALMLSKEGTIHKNGIDIPIMDQRGPIPLDRMTQIQKITKIYTEFNHCFRLQLILHEVSAMPDMNDPFFNELVYTFLGLIKLKFALHFNIQTNFPQPGDVTFSNGDTPPIYASWDSPAPENIPTAVIHDADDDCLICLESMNGTEVPRYENNQLQKIHPRCMKRWLETNPYARHPYTGRPISTMNRALIERANEYGGQY
jgi:hypothetical protein